MSETRLSLHYTLSKPVDHVYNCLADFRAFGELHPYMKRVDVLHDHRPEFIEYQVEEEILLFGWIRNHPEYTTRVFEIEKNKQLRYTSQVKKFIFLSIDFFLEENTDSSSSVREHIHITSNRLVARVFSGILKQAHAVVFRNIQV